MTMEMNSEAKIKVWTEDLVWLEQQPRTLERDHIRDILNWDIIQFQEAIAARDNPPPTSTDTAVVATLEKLERWMVKGNMSITISPPHDGFPWGVDWLTGDDGDWDVKSHRVTGDTLRAAILAATKEATQ